MHGIIAVAPSYRLTDCPGHMEDAVAAVHWTCKHLINLGANPNKIFLSGHSAGGNIAANLACSTWLKEVLDKYQVRILGAVCISGVYSLLNPLGGAYSSMKNKGFDKLYRLKVFGNDLEVLTRHSPVAQLRLMLGEPPYPANQCKICNIARAISNWKRSDTKSESTVLSSRCANEIGEVPTDDDSSQQFNVKAESHQDTLRCLSTSFLVMNAEFDVGLESDGQRFVELLHRVYKMQQDEVGTDTFEPQYCLLPELGHATITLDEKALLIASDFILSVFQQSECQ
jgi:acetyl esterase/lipase